MLQRSQESEQGVLCNRRAFSLFGATLLGSTLIGGAAAEAGAGTGLLSSLERQQLETFLAKLSSTAIDYFIENSAPHGLVLDRVSNSVEETTVPAPSTRPRMASIAATGFGLAALVLAAEARTILRETAAERVLHTLQYVEEKTPAEHHGWLFHFMDSETGARYGRSEVSSIDTALFYMGAIAAAEYFQGSVKSQVERMFAALDFELLLNPAATGNKVWLRHGFRIEGGQRSFLTANWDRFSEGVLLILLSLAALPGKADQIWAGWDRAKTWRYGGQSTFLPLSLFTYYYPLCFLPVRGMVDGQGDDFWVEARRAAAMQIEYCRTEGYPPKLFGITACDGPAGYQIYYPGHTFKEKILAPPAMLACLPLLEREAFEALLQLDRLGLLAGRYGPAAAFEPATGWTAKEMVGIDIGSALLMIDAGGRGVIHGLMRQSAILKRALERAGFRPVAARGAMPPSS